MRAVQGQPSAMSHTASGTIHMNVLVTPRCRARVTVGCIEYSNKHVLHKKKHTAVHRQRSYAALATWKAMLKTD